MKNDNYTISFVALIAANLGDDVAIAGIVNKIYEDGYEDGFNDDENKFINNNK